jgi:hypothetical protein
MNTVNGGSSVGKTYQTKKKQQNFREKNGQCECWLAEFSILSSFIVRWVHHLAPHTVEIWFVACV